MYNERDRADTRRMLLILGGVVAAIVFVLVGAGLLLNASATPSGGHSTPPPVVAKAETPPVAEAVVPAPTLAEAPVPAPVPAPAPAPTGLVVCIDPGHQAHADSSSEPIGPGASERKPKVSDGATGVATRKPESQVNLEVSLKLRDELVKRGVKVVMVRETQDVNISNSERAAIANRAGSALFIRIHCDGIGNKTTHGLSTLIPANNRWTGPILAPSTKAAGFIHPATIAATGAADRGVVTRSDLSGFNWATVPTILVEMGFMSNPDEDRLLSTADYQLKLAKGMADGTMQYLQSR